jgi:hypothetical protein
MSGSTTRGGVRDQKIAGIDPSWVAIVQQNSPPRYNESGPVTTGSPYIDPATGLPYPRSTG